MNCGVRKLESRGYRAALFAWSYVWPFWYNTGVWRTHTHTHTHTHTDRQTDRHTTTAYTALSKASRAKNGLAYHNMNERLYCANDPLHRVQIWWTLYCEPSLSLFCSQWRYQLQPVLVRNDFTWEIVINKLLLCSHVLRTDVSELYDVSRKLGLHEITNTSVSADVYHVCLLL